MAYFDANPKNNYKVYSGKITIEMVNKAIRELCSYKKNHNMNNLKERLTKYAKDKHLTLSEEAIDRMIKFANR